MRRRWALAIAGAALAASALLAGCDTTVTGTAQPAGGAGPGASTNTPARRTTLDCSGGTVIRPSGAPYCYQLPAGFHDATDQLTLTYQSANPSQYDSAVAVAVHDVIIVVVYPLRQDSDALSSSVLGEQVNAVLRAGESSGFTVMGSPTPTTVSGSRAFEIPIKQNDGQFSAMIYFVFNGFTEVEINCQWAQQVAEITRGCASVLKSVQIVDPPR
ncbi:MAG TPA: hypothetical protein VFW65_20575 [Pseudonocardiaceae bacterium]|nr:hypothetical protein [Pseudonocardiaceae bacterium]